MVVRQQNRGADTTREAYFVAELGIDFRHCCNLTHCSPGVGVTLSLDLPVCWNREGVLMLPWAPPQPRDVRESGDQGELPASHSGLKRQQEKKWEGGEKW